jgi:hypothetical protein
LQPAKVFDCRRSICHSASIKGVNYHYLAGNTVFNYWAEHFTELRETTFVLALPKKLAGQVLD